MSDRLRPLWDFEDVDATEARLREQLDREESDVGRAEVLTQLARVHSLRDEFDTCEELLQRAESLAGADGLVRVRVDLERGRKLRSGGDGAAAAPAFEGAFERACDLGEYWFAGDAAHMVAISVPEKMVEWTERGLELADSQPEAAYWARAAAEQPRLALLGAGRRRAGARGVRACARGAQARPGESAGDQLGARGDRRDAEGAYELVVSKCSAPSSDSDSHGASDLT